MRRILGVIGATMAIVAILVISAGPASAEDPPDRAQRDGVWLAAVDVA